MTATTRGSPVGGNESQNQTQNQTPSPNSSNETSPIGPPEEAGQGEAPPTQEEEEPAFPHTDLAKLDEMINRPRWVVPVLPKGELEVLLEAAVDLSKKGPMSRVMNRISSSVSLVQGWLVHLINKFGTLNGFQILHDRFTSGQALNVQIIAALIRYVHLQSLNKHLTMVPQFLENLTDEELKKEAKNEAKNDALSMIIKSLKNLASRVPGQEETVKNLEIFRLKMILRLLQISSFNGKMNALNEVNKVISSVSYYTHRHGHPEEEEWLTAERMAEWIQQNSILSIVLRDSLHQPQYVEKLEKILRFVIKEKALTLQDLDSIWAAQAGKHEAIVKNVHDLLAKLAWDFSPEQLDHLFACFEASWTNAGKKQREKLLELIRRLAEDDKDGVMAHKVLNLLWNLAHSDDVPVDIMDQALSAHIKILDYSCSQLPLTVVLVFDFRHASFLPLGTQYTLDSKTQELTDFLLRFVFVCPEYFLLITCDCLDNCSLLFQSTAKERAKHAGDYFTLLRHLLNYAFNSNINLPNAEVLLNNEIDWLKRIRDEVKRTGETGVEETILEGHLGVTKELLAFQTPEKKFYIGCEKGGANLIKELIDDFIFPASNVYLQFVKSGEFPAEQATPVCSSPASVNAGFELLVALSVGCVRNLKQIVDTLTDMYYLGCEALTEWEYLPPVGPRPTKGFVGLKNAGATCYMNSVIQQLYMIPPIRNGILAIEGTGSDIDDDMSGDNESNVEPRDDVFSYHPQFDDEPSLNKAEDRKEYNIGVLRHLQVIFGHLAASRLQYYVPRGFWKQFRYKPVSLREQHDALEFFNSLVDSLDEALKALGHPSMLSRILGGSFADQKICQGCPHRYECEESFTTLNVDIRNHQNLLDSLEQYVKGDLLEGANAYHCEKCNKKVDTVKRLLIRKLPPVLAIQLKRFDYDWERKCAIKFNDYFEFPRELDMEPYTKLEGAEVLPESQVIAESSPEESDPNDSSRYRLVGVLVHSGQASGGHYYSYVMQRHGNSSDGQKDRWYKFDDGDVTECKMEDDEEMKNQCFGGEYMMKRMSYRWQKRWWNAYILFYERMDAAGGDGELLKYISELTLAPRTNQPKMPLTIEASVRKQNVQFMHSRMQYSLEYFQFVKKLLTCNSVYLNPPPGQDHLLPEAEEIAMISIQLAARFLFSTGFHTKKVVRGPAGDWYDALCILLRHSKNVRSWFAHNVLFAFPTRFSEYLLECPSAEVRGAFAKLVVFIAHFSLQDGPCPAPVTSPGSSTQACDSVTLSDHLLRSVLNLLRREVSEHGRHLQQYFNLFVMYANLGLAEKTQLLKLSVPATFMLVALDEGPGPPIKYQYAELGKLYAVVSQLVRCCDVSARMQSSINGECKIVYCDLCSLSLQVNNQPYTGPAAQHMNNPQRPQESWEGVDEVPPVQTKE
uniref:USP domain-containing protein n=1 Tax=Cyprinus carpio TaxID=7962 RepID=A0A8C1LPE6_CYPCA